MSWDKVKLADCCLSISDGDHQPPPKAVSGVPFVTIANINKSNQFDFSDTMFVPKDYYDRLDSKRKAQVGDILYSVVGSFGIPVLIKEERPFVFQRHIAILRPNERINSAFLYYTMLSRDFYAKADAAAIGAAQRTVSLTSLRGMEIELPPLKVQEAIASKLSVYDNLIENNQKQIKLLEEAAQRLYKEWFVDLRFPGYEDTPIVGGVPEGWEKVPVGNLISYEIGGGWGEETPTGKCIREAYVIRGTDLYGIAHGDLLSIPFRYHVESNLSSRKLKDGDIVFEVSGGSRTEGVARCLLITSSMLNVWRKDVMCASFCKLIRPQFGFSQYLHDCIKHLRATGKTEEYDKRSASSIVNYRWKDFLSQELVLRPSEEILDHYNGVAKEIYSKAINCSLQIESAKKARDRLLPKLMSGEIEV